MTTPNKPKPAKRKPKAFAPVATVVKSRSIQLEVQPGQSTDRAVAAMVARGMVSNASTVIRFQKAEHEDISLMEMTRELRAQGEAVNRGDLSAPEQMLTAQAMTLNAIFGEMARRASLNMGEYLDASERYMRLALKAQSQCRATVETLAAMKNPPVVFAKQANIANGPQQVNNGTQQAQCFPRTPETQTRPNELLEDLSHGSQTLDTGATPGTGRANQDMVPVGKLNRPTHP